MVLLLLLAQLDVQTPGPGVLNLLAIVLGGFAVVRLGVLRVVFAWVLLEAAVGEYVVVVVDWRSALLSGHQWRRVVISSDAAVDRQVVDEAGLVVDCGFGDLLFWIEEGGGGIKGGSGIEGWVGISVALGRSALGEVVVTPLLCLLLEAQQDAFVVADLLSVQLLLDVALETLPLLSEFEEGIRLLIVVGQGVEVGGIAGVDIYFFHFIVTSHIYQLSITKGQLGAMQRQEATAGRKESKGERKEGKQGDQEWVIRSQTIDSLQRYSQSYDLSLNPRMVNISNSQSDAHHSKYYSHFCLLSPFPPFTFPPFPPFVPFAPFVPFVPFALDGAVCFWPSPLTISSIFLLIWAKVSCGYSLLSLLTKSLEAMLGFLTLS